MSKVNYLIHVSQYCLHALQTSLDAAFRGLISNVDDNGQNVIINYKKKGVPFVPLFYFESHTEVIEVFDRFGIDEEVKERSTDFR